MNQLPKIISCKNQKQYVNAQKILTDTGHNDMGFGADSKDNGKTMAKADVYSKDGNLSVVVFVHKKMRKYQDGFIANVLDGFMAHAAKQAGVSH